MTGLATAKTDVNGARRDYPTQGTRVHNGIELGWLTAIPASQMLTQQATARVHCIHISLSSRLSEAQAKESHTKHKTIDVQQLLALKPTYTSVLSHGGPSNGTDSLAERCKSKLSDSGLVQFSAP